jgi:hypothetical protein
MARGGAAGDAPSALVADFTEAAAGGESGVPTVVPGSPIRKLWAEACFHAGAACLARGDRSGAQENFRLAYQWYDSEIRYTYHGKLLFIRMQNSVAWPAWISLSSGEAEDAPADFRGGHLLRDAGKERS